MDQEICREGVINDGKASKLFVDVETVALNDVCYGELGDRHILTRKYEPKNMKMIGKRMQMRASIMIPRTFYKSVSIPLKNG